MKTIFRKVNAYNILDKGNEVTVLYHSVAASVEQVKELAEDQGVDLSGLVIELERSNVKDELGRPVKPYFEDALIY